MIGDEIPSLEIKSEKRIAYCYPSYHIHGHRYQIIGTCDPITLDVEQIDKLQELINALCKQYGIEYADSSLESTEESGRTCYTIDERSTTLASKLWQSNTVDMALCSVLWIRC